MHFGFSTKRSTIASPKPLGIPFLSGDLRKGSHHLIEPSL